MLVINPYIFKRFPEISFGFSTKIGMNRKKPYYFNMSYSVGDEKNRVKENRVLFSKSIGIDYNSVAYQKQVHSDIVTVVEKSGICGKSDAMITAKKNLGLAIGTADCCGIFIYDSVQNIISAVHSGWKGTCKKILLKVLQKLSNDFNSKADNLSCYLSPSISQHNYEVGREVAELFDAKYLKSFNDKFLLNISEINKDILLNFGVKKNNIQVSKLCTYEYSSILQSYRRDGKQSGRAWGIIAMKGNL
jgi:YfiH family protein